jgi:hypothetical protein
VQNEGKIGFVFKNVENLFKEEVEQYIQRYTDLLILFGIIKNCPIIGRCCSLCIFIQRVIKQIVVVIEAYHCYQLHTEFYKMFFQG